MIKSLPTSVIVYLVASGAVGLAGTLYVTDFIDSGLVMGAVVVGWNLSWVGVFWEESKNCSGDLKGGGGGQLWFIAGLGLGIAAATLFSTLALFLVAKVSMN
jgi:hypothetical protein